MSPNPIRILMVVSEAQPFSKTGGLADVATSLSQALGKLGHHVSLVTPRYRGVEPGIPCGTVRAHLAGEWIHANLSRVSLGHGAHAVLVDSPSLYDRDGIYGHHHADYGDNPLRFAFLARAALQWAAGQPQPF